MPYRSTPPEQTWPSQVTRKRMAAEKREAAAARFRAEADDLERRWIEYRKQTEHTVARCREDAS